jgi:molybdopterin synthase sulfur carrier subunit
MHQLRVLAFAQARSLLGHAEQILEVLPTDTPRVILERLIGNESEQICGSCRVAIDLEYRAWDDPVGEASEIAVIPPVSGG